MSLRQTFTSPVEPADQADPSVRRLARLDGPPETLLEDLLGTQCGLGQAAAGAVVQLNLTPGAAAGQSTPTSFEVQIRAVYPPTPAVGSPPSWLAHGIELAMAQPPDHGTQVHRLQATDPGTGRPVVHHLIIVPVRSDHGFRGFEAFLLETDDPAVLAARRRRLELSVALLSIYEMRQALERQEASLRGVSTATRVLAAGNDHPRFRAAAMALCNEIATRWQADRVSLGMLGGRYIKLRAMSQTEHLNRKMLLVQAIESAMEECLDQDTEVMFPAPPEATLVNRAAQELSTQHGPVALCSLPLRSGGEVVGVVTVERAADRPLSVEEIGFLRIACDLFTARVTELSRSDRWWGARLADAVRNTAAGVVGPRYTWAKLTAVALLAGVLALVFVPGTIRVEAPFAFQAVIQRSIPAPFDGYLDEVRVDPDDRVEAGAVLAVLDTAELRAERARLEAEGIASEKEAKIAVRDGKQVERQIAEARVASIEAQIAFLDWQIEHAVIRSPLAGTVVVGDLKQKLGAPVAKGDVLFEVAPLETLRAELLVEDHMIGDVSGRGARGQLAAAAYPGRKIDFEVEQIYPLAEVVDGRNVFRVRAELLTPQPWAKPGIEGVAKIDAGQAPIGWVWTREAVNWVRMKLWI